MSKLIAVTGPIAAGASTLAGKLADLMSVRRYLEENVEGNLFFKDFHKEPQRWAFTNQVVFLTKSAENHVALRGDTAGTVYIQDFTPFEHTGVYAAAQHKEGRLSEDEYTLLQRLTRQIESLYKVPSVLVYRRISRGAMRQRILERGRPSEQSLDDAYLDAVWTKCEEWCAQWDRSPLIIVNETVDVLTDDAYLQQLTEEIRRHLKV